MIVKHYTSTLKDLAPYIARLKSLFADRHEGVEHRAISRSGDTLQAWLGNLHIHEDEYHRSRGMVNKNVLALYYCTWCNNPSAILKKCSRCTKTRSVQVDLYFVA